MCYHSKRYSMCLRRGSPSSPRPLSRVAAAATRPPSTTTHQWYLSALQRRSLRRAQVEELLHLLARANPCKLVQNWLSTQKFLRREMAEERLDLKSFKGRAIRGPILSVLVFILHDLPYSNLQRPTINTQKSVCQNLIMGQSYEPRRTFLPAFTCLDFPNMVVS
jgi:hypothetical protein